MDDRPIEALDPDADEVRRHGGRQRLGILAAVDEALRRYDELIPLIVGSANRAEATAAVARALGVDEVEATGVLDLQWGHLTEADRRRIADDRRRQERDLAD